MLFLSFLKVQAQDSLSLYSNIENQLDQLRVLNKEYYRNPANMLNYGNASFSDIGLFFQNFNRENYLMQEGSSQQQFKLETTSYKTTKDKGTLWGSASYRQVKTKDVRWNNNIDLERIAPLVIADSVGGDQNLQNYHFKGGYAKTLRRFSLASELEYTAGLSYKTQDPRPKNTTSYLNFKAGLSYLLTDRYRIGLSAGLNKYLQSSQISFSSEIQRTPLYQMNGMGTYNFYFSNKTSSAYFKDFAHHYLLTIGTEDRLFSVTTGTLFGSLSKDTGTSGNSNYEINRITRNSLFLHALKIIKLNDYYEVGGKLDFEKQENKGYEILYTNNTSVLQKLLEKQNYYYTNNETRIHVILRHQSGKSNTSVIPYFSKLRSIEKKTDDAKLQDFEYHRWGVNLFHMQQLSALDVLTFQAHAYKNKTKQGKNIGINSDKPGINEWLQHDLIIRTLDYNAIAASLRYDRKVQQNRSVYAIFALDYITFSDNNNNIQTTLSLGVTF